MDIVVAEAFALAFAAIHNAAHHNKASATTNTLGVYICGDIICTTTSGVTSSEQLYAHEHIAILQEHMQKKRDAQDAKKRYAQDAIKRYPQHAKRRSAHAQTKRCAAL